MIIENDAIILESRDEIAMLQTICEGFIALSKSAVEDGEKELAKELSAKLEVMWLSW